MFIIEEDGNNAMFRDIFNITLNDSAYNNEDIACSIIEAIFNLDQVLVIDPIIVPCQYPNIQQLLLLKVNTKPIDNKNDMLVFENILNNINGVKCADAIVEVGATNKINNKCLYGGKRSKR